MRRIAQGDVTLIPVDALPADAVKLDTKVLQESETTGHHHHFTQDAPVTVFQTKAEPSPDLTITPDFGKYVTVELETELFHGKGFARDPNIDGTGDHKALTVPPGTYKVVIKREFDYSTMSHKRVVD
jgi:hypothetical protein